MQLNKIQLKNFRCFNNLNLELNGPLILIEGENGSGKTSILEALSYLCYLRSFRTHITKELINEKSNDFFVKAKFDLQNQDNEIQVGFSGKKRLVKINNKSVQSYKDLMQYYRAILLSEDDLNLIKSGPDIRRTFIDQHIILHDAHYLFTLRKYKQILENRNALLFKGAYKYEDYLLWTKELWEQSLIIQNIRIEALKNFEIELNHIFAEYFPKLKASFKYEPKMDFKDNFDLFLDSNSNLYNNEQYNKRSLFGTHLDDFSINFMERKTKIFASRGQQKLLVLLIKIAQIRLLSKEKQDSIIFLLDDFMTDFDDKRLEMIMPLLYSLNVQLIFTCPLQESPLRRLLLEKRVFIVPLALK